MVKYICNMYLFLRLVESLFCLFDLFLLCLVFVGLWCIMCLVIV